MISAKKSSHPVPPSKGIRRELKHLYARRSAIDALINTLQNYDRCRGKVCTERKPKNA